MTKTQSFPESRYILCVPLLLAAVTAGYGHTVQTSWYVYRISGIFRVGKFLRKCRLEGMLNFHWILFLLFQGFPMATYSRIYFSLCLFLKISGKSWTQRKLNPREKFPIYGIMIQTRYRSSSYQKSRNIPCAVPLSVVVTPDCETISTLGAI